MTSRSDRTDILRQVADGKLSPKDGARRLLALAASPAPAASVQGQTPDPAIAIIGFAGQFPGARDVREFWENLAAGRDSVTDAPVERRESWRGVAAERYRGGFLAQFDLFDPLFFNTSPKEAEVMDPQQRLFLLESCRALADAGYSRETLKGSRTGVFAGCQGGDYAHLLAARLAPDSYGFLGNLVSILPARVAYFFDFKGPCLAVDTACSSSLVAVHLACESLRKGESELALAGGVSVLATPRFHAQAIAAEMLAPDGRCKTFDAAADGFVPAEGVGVVVLKRLDRALADRDTVHGIIRGSGLNQDGKSNGISAPNGPSQSSLESAVYAACGIDPATLGYVEAHGTGTRLGDPIEFDALVQAFRGYTDQQRFCGIGSVKSNIGHSLTASGVAGLIKLLLCLKHRELVPSLHFHQGNGAIDFENSPFYVNTRRIPWNPPPGIPRRAAISAFGLSGTNCHLVIEEPGDPRPTAGAEWPWPGYLVTLSARTETALARQAADLKAWLESADQGERLIDIAFTLRVGRDDYPYRWACVVRDPPDLLARLGEALRLEPGSLAAKISGKALDETPAEAGRRLLDDWPNPPGTDGELWERLGLLADLYRQGHALPLEKLYAGRDCRRISLPGYPFDLRRCWLPLSDTATQDIPTGAAITWRAGGAPGELHFAATLTGREFFLADHLVNGRKILPAAAYIDMVMAVGRRAGLAAGSLRNLVWSRPLDASGAPVEVRLVFTPQPHAHGFEIRSGDGTLHAQGTWADQPAARVDERLDLAALRSTLRGWKSKAERYALFKRGGIEYGSTFQAVEALWRDENAALARLVLPQALTPRLAEFAAHPALLDGALQTVIGLIADADIRDNTPYLPFAIGEIAGGLLPAEVYVYAVRSGAPPARTGLKRFDMTVTDAAGAVVMTIRDFAILERFQDGAVGANLFAPANRKEANKFAPTETPYTGSENALAVPSEPMASPAERLYFEEAWEAAPLEDSAVRAESPAVCLLIDTDGGTREALRASFVATGQPAPALILARPGPAFGQLDASTYQFNADSPEDYERLLAALAAEGRPPAAVVHLLARGSFEPSPAALAEQLRRGVYSFLYLSQALLRRAGAAPGRLFFVYPQERDCPQPHYAAVAALARTVSLENRHLTCQAIQVVHAPATPERDRPHVWAEALRRELATDGGERDTRWTDGVREARRLREFAPGMASAPRVRPGGVYLITGGLGAIPLTVAEHLAHAGAKLALVGRSYPNARKQARLNALSGPDAPVLYWRADVADETQARRVVAQVRERFGRIDGVFHFAGVRRDAYLVNKTARDMDEVLAPKVFGTLHLDQALGDAPLDFFCMASSVSAIAGNIGQGDYAYANRFMDAFADWRRARNRPGLSLSINWPYWEEGGMRVDPEVEKIMAGQWRMNPLSNRAGLEILDAALAGERGRFMVVEGDGATIRARFGVGAARHIAPESHNPPGEKPMNIDALRARVEDTLRGFVSQLLKIDPADIDGEEELGAFGIDSINLTRLTNRINERYSLAVLPTLFFEYHTLRDVAGHLLQAYPDRIKPPVATQASAPAVAAEIPPAPVSPSPSAIPLAAYATVATPESPHPSPAQMPIAIIGLAGVMPQSDSLYEFWSQLAEGRSLVTEVPPERWDWREHYGDPQSQPGKTQAKWGGFIRDADQFDAPFFNIAPREAELMDPQQRLFLECVWAAIEDAGYRPGALARSKTGVYAGVCTWDYHELLRDHAIPVDAYLSTGAAHSVVSNRVSYLLDLRGPSETVDTACSSSLVAIHRAVQAIQSGHCELAIAGGVQVMATPSAHIAFDRAGMLSRQGQARPFDAEADGYVRGEGAGVVLLKPLDRALRDGDPIRAVIRGTATNHGGKANSFTAPNPQAQAEVIAEAWQRAGLDPATATYIEAHGTGTRLGDPVEINGLKKAFGQLFEQWGHAPTGEGRCAIGSVKANIGHLEAAAGIAGVLKVILAFEHGTIPGIAHFREANPLIQLEDSPFRLAERTMPWPRLRDASGRPLSRRAGVSSFGFGGANAHVVLEEFLPEPETEREDARPVLILLSAADAERLRAQVLRLIGWLEQAPASPAEQPSLRRIAHTLHVGREAMDERLALVATDARQLLDRLRGWVETGTESADLFRGSLPDGKTAALYQGPAGEAYLRSLARAEDWHRLGQTWAQGADLAHIALYPDRPRRVALPTYPFARHRYWVPRSARPAAKAPESRMGIHPLLDGPAAAAPGTQYTKLLRQEEFFLADHRIGGRLILPGVAHIEMARAACAAASGQRVAALRNIVWIRPIVLETPTLAVDIELAETQGELAFEIAYRDAAGGRVLCTQGKAVLAPADGAEPEPERLDVADILPRCTLHRGREAYYQLLRDVQFDLGPSFQVIRDMHAAPDEVLTLLELPPHLRGDTGFALHPSLLDGAIQTVAGVTAQRLKARYLPFTLGRIEIVKPLPDRLYAHARLTQTLRQGEAPLLKFTMRLADEQGEVCVRFHDFIAAPFGSAEPPDRRPAGEVLRLKPRWQPTDREATPATVDGASHTWVLFAADEASARTLRGRFAQAGAEHILVARPGAEFQPTGAGDFLIRPEVGADYGRLLREAGGRPVRLVHAWSHPALRGGTDAATALRLGPTSLFLLCRELARARGGEPAELLYVYPWAKHVLVGALAGVGGLARTLRQEMPWLNFHTVGLACGGAEDFPGVLADAALNLAGEFGARGGLEIRYAGERRSVKQMVEADPADFPPPEPPAESSVFRREGVYLITGGLGAIGMALAGHIAAAGSRLVLAGRSAPDAAGLARIEAISAAGRVRYVRADVSDREQTRRLIEDIRATEGRLDGILHGAGILRDGLIANKEAADFAAVLAPKILGALYLDEAVGSGPLDCFVCCSSIAALLGNAGQGDYALANLAMDEFMQWRDDMRRFGLRSGRSLSIDWPLWRDGAMGTDATARELMKTALGLEPLDTATALSALEQGLRGGLANFAVLRGEPAKLLAAFDRANAAPAKTADAAPTQVEPSTRELTGTVETAIRDLAARIVKVSIDKLPANRELTKLGFDSITLTELANGLNKEIGLELTPAMFFEYASLGALARYLCRDHHEILVRKYGQPPATPVPPTVAEAVPPQAPTPSTPWVEPLPTEARGQASNPGDRDEPIAIVGMSGIMPGSRDLEEFWDNLAAGRNLVREIPPDRWDWRQYYGDPGQEANKTDVKWGGFMPEVDKFDAAFFDISPREARLMDPQQRLFLETAWAAIEDAGYRVSDLSGMKIGLFVGVASLDYMEMLREHRVDIQAHTSTGISHAVLVNRVSYLLNLSGPSEPTDTACSSSLVAFHRALEAIRSGTCEAALVGGVNALLNPTLHISFGKAGMLAVDGKCKTFDAGADGYVRGEGVGAVFLKRLGDAERDGDDIRAVIRGSFVNHGGRATSLTAPNPAAQSEVVTRAWERAGLDPATASYIEAHGTGTKLGDPVEITGLKRAFAELCARRGQDALPASRCGIGSVKSNIGHLETAAGIASVLKVVLAMRHGVLPKTLHFQARNPYIDLDGSPFYLVTETTPWQRPRDARGAEIPRRAGISGFGFGGANAHLVLEEYRTPAAEDATGAAEGPVLIVLSARTPSRLREVAARLHGFVAKTAGGGDTAERELLARIAHTLQCGREALEERLAFTAEDLDELARKLGRFLDPQASFADGFRGRSDHGGPFDAPVPPDEAEQRAIDAWLAEGALIPLAEAWCRGAAIDWRPLYTHRRQPRRLSLPTYPFERRAYWFETRPDPAGRIKPESTPAPVPASATVKTPVVLRKLGTLEPPPETERATTTTPPPEPTPSLAAAAPVAAESDPPPRRDHPGTRAMSREVRQKLQSIVVETLYLADDCDLNKEFVHLGADSVLGVEIIRRVNTAFGLAMSTAKLYEFPSIKRLAEYVTSLLPEPAAPIEPEPEPALETFAPPAPELKSKPSFTPPPVAEAPPAAITPTRSAVNAEASIQTAAPVQAATPERNAAETPIAIVGMAGRFAGARDAEEFWRMLAEGRSGVVEVPPTRWDYAEHYDPTGKAEAKTLSKWGGFLDGIDEFDPLLFGIAPAEAELMDPQQRLFLQAAYHALEDAGHAGAGGAGSRCGVFVGVGRGDYGQLLIRSRKNLNAYAMMGLNSSILAARIAYWLNLTGPSIALDTACSSSLVAIHQACRSLRAGESDLALAGGACVLTTPDTHIMTSKAGMLSPDGLCRPFDSRANGFVPGEGVGVIVLKDLRRALDDGDTIHGVILGSGINQDGRTNGITAPSGAAQRQLIREVHKNSGIAPGRIGYMETHGTGTPLGDPIEIQALIEAYGDHGGQGCVLGSVKANVGHALEAAGMAGVFKVLLALKHRQLPPQIHFDALNPHIALAGSPFRINTGLEPWESPGPRAAAISAFGFSGTNCHLVIEEAPATRPAAAQAKPAYLFALSGRNAAALRSRIADLGAWLDAEGGRHDPAAISYSLNAGRGHFAVRRAFVAASLAELRGLLAEAEASSDLDTERRVGLGPALEEFMAHLTHEIAAHPGLGAEAYRRKLLAVADLYAQGGDPDWDALHGGAARRRIPLPLYPYAREKYWVPEPDARSPDEASRNPGNGESARRCEQATQTTCHLSERDYHSADHRVGQRKLMPGAALLELARARGAAMAGRRVVALADNAWLSPLELSTAAREVRVEIVPAGDGAAYYVRSDGTLHAKGKLVFQSAAAEGTPPRRDLDAIRARCRDRVSGDDLYAGFQRAGLDYGPAYRPIQTLWKGDHEALAELRLPPGLEHGLDRDGLHPTLLDGALQTVVGLIRQVGPDSAPRLPSALEWLAIHAPLVGHCFAHIHADPDSPRCDLGLYSPAGEVLLELRGFMLAAPMGRAAAKSSPELSSRLALYRPEWAEVGPADGPALADGPLLVFMDREESLGSHAELSAMAGPGPVLIAYGGAAFAHADGAFTLRPDRPEDYAALVLALKRRGQLPARVLHLWAAPFQTATHGGLDAALALGAHSAMHFLRVLYREHPRAALHFVFAHPRREDAAGLAFGAMTGLLQSFGRECPGFSFRTVEYPGQGMGYRPLLDEFRAGPGTAIRYRDSARLARRYRKFAAEPAPFPVRQGGVYLVTGGLGDLGLLVAEHLARSAAGVKLILAGRSAPSRTETLRALESLGAKVLVVAADVAQREQVQELVRQARARFGALHGVIHCAGVIRDATLLNKDAAQAEAVWAPKVRGTLFLDEATAADDLDFFVLFSSVAAVLGNAGQCDYAFANGFMDGFAAWRHSHRPGRTLSLNWPLWRDCAQGRDELVRAQYERSLRLEPLATRAALAALAAALGTDAPQVLVFDGADAALTGFLAGETRAAEPPAATGRAASAGTADILAALKRDVLASIARILKIREDDIRAEDDLSELGLTSISLTEWNEALRKEFRLELQPTFLFGHRTVESIAEALFEKFETPIHAHYQSAQPAGTPAPSVDDRQHRPDPAAPPEPEHFQVDRRGEFIRPFGNGMERVDPPRHIQGRMNSPLPTQPYTKPGNALGTADIAIVGLSGRMPGSASLDEFWEHLERGADLIREVPAERWDWRAQGGSGARRWGGFIDGVDRFDAKFFGISPREAALMDPQQRLFLETVWHAIEDAGHRPDTLCAGKVGLFVGVSGWDYAQLMADANTEVGAHVSTGIAHSVLANRISYLLDLKGPSEPVDTACSSSLVAIHRAVQAIRHGECGAAIAGGVNVLLDPAMHQSFDRAGMLSPGGRCKTFDAAADGYVRGEGVGAIVLKPLAQAEADGDPIYAVIKGSAINHGGHVSSLTVPNPRAQAEVIVAAMEQARIDPATLTYVEVHGTGTALGDPVEVEGLKAAFAELYRRWDKPGPEAPHCALGTVKTQVGHLEAAAGIAGVIKLLLSLKHRRLPGIAHFQTLNPVLELRDSPFAIATATRPWPTPRDAAGAPVPRRAGVSSFGFGGVNAHIVLEEYSGAPASAAGNPEPVSITLSATSPERLRACAAGFLAYLDKAGRAAPALVDIAFTLHAGRVALVERLGLVVSSHDELRDKLRAYLRGEPVAGLQLANARTARAQVNGAEARIAALVAGRNLDELTRLWTLGASVPWESLYRNPRRVALPGYAFERTRYWFDAIEAEGDSRPPESVSEPVKPPVSAGPVPVEKPPARIRLVKTTEYAPDAAPSPAVAETPAVSAMAPEPEPPRPAVSAPASAADERHVKAAVVQQLARVLYLDARDIDSAAPFQELGMDSILGVEFINKLNQNLGINLKAADLYAHPSVESLSAHLQSGCRGDKFALSADTGRINSPPPVQPAIEPENAPGSASPASPAPPDQTPVPAGRNPSGAEAIAIIGLSGRYPLSDDLDSLWHNLKTGRNCITEVPPERWDASRFYDPEKGKVGRSCSKWGGFIGDVDKFDPLFFNIPPVEAKTMDPQERLFLEAAWHACENAGHPRARLRQLQDEHGLGIGVFVGAMASQYAFVHPDPDTGALFSMIHHWTIANRASYFFDFRGPSLVVDTACSSSLLAIHLACESIRRGESLMAVAGGVNLLLHPSKYLGLNQIGVLGSQPRSRSLGLSDGYVPGEGVGAVLLKPLALAERDGDRILGVILGSSANHGGTTNGFGVPNPQVQSELIVSALRNAGVDPRTLGYVEVAANGSPVGDAIEIDALNRAFREFTDLRNFCAIGSVKANIGHLEPASGISQLTKVLLQLRHGTLVPSINAEPANPDVNLEDSPFYLPKAAGDWPRRVLRENGVDVEYPRRAAINSFGIGGTNVQLIVEEYPASAPTAENDPAATETTQCFPLSARDPATLRRQAARLRAFLGAAERVSLDRLAATLQCHREPLAERLAIVARTRGQLLQALDDYLAGRNDPAAYVLHAGRRELHPAPDDIRAAPGLPDPLAALVAVGDWDRVAALWVRGANVPWRQTAAATPLELPPYPFERRACWFAGTGRAAVPQPAPEDFQTGGRGEFIRPLENDLGRMNSPLQARPHTHTENTLASLTHLVAEVLELEPAKLDPAESLLSYGIDSIVLMRIRNRLKESHGFDLDPARMAELNTLQRLAEALAAQAGAAASISAPPVAASGVWEIRIPLDGEPEAPRPEAEIETLIAELVAKGIALDAPGGELRLRGAAGGLDAPGLAALSGAKAALARYLAGRKFQPLSACQKRYWTLSLLQTRKSAYINPLSIHLTGELDPASLDAALRRAMDRNEVLRAVYPALNRQPVQVVAPAPWRGDIPVEDFAALPAAESQARLDRLITQESTTPINPKTGPNVRLRLVRLSAREHVLLITAHHVLFDGFAFEPLLRQVFEDYEALRAGQEPRCRDIAQYVEFTLEETRRRAELADQRDYWRAVLRDAPGITPLPVDHPRPAANSFSGDSIVRVLDARPVEALKIWLSRRPASLFVGLLAVFGVVMRRWTGERRLVIGTTVQNRDRRDFEDVIGDFTNFIPLVMEVEAGLSFADWVGRTRHTVEQALAYKALSFDEMIPMAPRGPANVNPLYNIHVNHLPPHRPARINDRLGAEFRNNRALNRSAMLDLRFEWFEAPDGFHVLCEYNTDLFERHSIENLLRLFETTLAELAANPTAPLEAAPAGPARPATDAPERSPQDIMAELRTVYAELLSIDLERVGDDDSFLELGGNSMLAVQLVTEIEERFVAITAADIFEHSSIRQMAGLIAGRLGPARTPPEAPPPPATAPAPTEPNRQETFYRLRRLNKAG